VRGRTAWGGRVFRLAVGVCCLFVGGHFLADLASPAFPFPVEALDRFGASRVVLDRNGEILRVTVTKRGEKLLPVTLEEVSPHLVHAVLAGEDKGFYGHLGVDWVALARAGLTDLLRGRIVSGASTLSMQVARIVEPGGPRLWRKTREIFRARELERLYTKKEILGFYLNLAPLGGILRGFEAGSLFWFGKHASALGPAEAASLAAMLPAPSARRPDRHPELLRWFRNLVLDRMLRCGYLGRDEWARERSSPLGARPHPWPFLAPHACDYALARTNSRVVRTDLDLGIQRRMEKVVRGFGGPGADGVALVVLDGRTGGIRAMVGSRDYRRIPLNACLCRRPAGSTWKPFLYALAFRKGAAGPEGILSDRPLRIGDYRPANFTRDFAGRIRAGEALAVSRNLPAIRLLRAVGVDSFRGFLSELGLSLRERPLYLDLALGTESASPLGLARAWRIFSDPAEGLSVEWKFRSRVLEILGRRSPDPSVLGPGRAAWKTGTSADRRDAWTVGNAGGYVICVWLGNLDDRSDPGLVGGRSAAILFARAAAALE